MSVVIKGVKMPDMCSNCFMYNEYERECVVCSFGIPARYNYDDSSRPEWCPLVDLPEKHGDLIDRKELEKAVLKWMPHDPCGIEEREHPFETDICVSMMMEIEEQVIIFEAEG